MKKGRFQPLVFLLTLLSLLWPGSLLEAASHDASGDDFPDYIRLEYAKPLPPVAEQATQPKPGSIDMKVGMQQPSVSVSPESIPVHLGRSLPTPDDSEPSLAGILDDSQVSTTTALVVPK